MAGRRESRVDWLRSAITKGIAVFNPASVLLATLLVAACATSPAWAASTTVYFPSGDGKTELVAFIFKPQGAGRFPALVMLHGRAGPYSSTVNAACALVRRGESSPCNAETQSKRAQMWGEFWAQRGVLAIHVDSFGPRGFGHGFGRNTHDDPQRDAVNELTVRPLDADGALTYLRSRQDVIADRIAIQGWSNGGSTALNVMYRQATGKSVSQGFRAALSFYPGCGPKALLTRRYEAGAATLVFLGGNDEEVNPDTCRKLLTDAPAGGDGRLQLVWFDGASHDFDNPDKSRQSVAANRSAQQDALKRAEEFIRNALTR